MLGGYQRRKRPVTACQPCYQKKQRCDRQVPCSNCMRRKQPELCHYAAVTIRQHSGEAGSSTSLQECRSYRQSSDYECSPSQNTAVPRHDIIDDKRHPIERLLDKFGFSPCVKFESQDISAGLVLTLQDCFEAYPRRSITDTLVQSFFEDIRRSGQQLDQALFSESYKEWWNQAPVQGLEQVMFGILLLRVCCIGSAFLQSGTSMNKQILAIGISEVSTHCDKLANRIQDLIQGMPGTKSTIYVQIIYLDAVYHSIQGHIETAWYKLSSAIRIVQHIGVNVNPQGAQHNGGLKSEIQAHHLMFLDVLIMDSILCFFLDRPPTVSEKRFIDLQSAEVGYHTNPRLESEPSLYTELMLQAKLWQLWTAMKEEDGGATFKSKSIPTQVEQRYRRLKRSFIDQLPNAFNLDHPDKQWDQQNLILKHQREWLHVNILMVQCGILQDSLLLDQAALAGMSQSERSMTHKHVKLLANSTAALREALSSLHSLSGFAKGAIAILQPFATRSAILAGLSFINIRSMHAGSRPSRSWPDYQSEDAISLKACKSHIHETLISLMASQDDPSSANETKSLQAILGRMDDLSARDVNIDVIRNDLTPQQFSDQSLIGGSLGESPNFPLLATSDFVDRPASFTSPPSMYEFEEIQNNNMQNNDYLSMFFDITNSSH
ncbi:hypothetical protein P153DRAFT_423864 [Dothidotthia symphoricarpi CBS 119687]|uniref:Zn(2)-C6 fungal-type domain-containing protein n=1 Tax=Dothidotthia symphoricarpi CBS 119687 TaxID=1392245 RepID=A0A6A6A759_9PLEO|nr:uncharacterized protein P153DRAFT_423864 [Dothidotthia symphoricarpi CBS 119687]KAF2127852.1 hypothetical protein P153DRAFT_423864 [Dothidotthia symphoricarpi CBS 119687]